MQSTHLEARETKDFELLIGGNWVSSVSGKRFQVVNPYDGKPWATVPRGVPEDVDLSVKAAREAFDSGTWSGDSSLRVKTLRKFGDLIAENAEYLAELETKQNGKLFREMVGQMRGLPDYYHYFGGLADKLEGRTIPVRKDIFIYTLREPVGVVAAITAWNSPLLLLTFKLAPGLAAGNTFVIKPSQHTPVSALEFCRIVQASGIPPGVLNVVTGYSSEIGDALVTHPGVDKIGFTGSTATGIDIAKKAAAKLIRTTLELGGKSPNIVFSSANLDEATNGILAGIFAATGQTCVAGSRLFVQEEVYDELMQKLVARTKQIRLGDPMKTESEMGTVAFIGQLNTIDSYVKDGVHEGAKLLTGGKRATGSGLDQGLFYEPTVLVDVRNDMKVAREEIFGPVLCVMKFKEEDEVIRLANDTRYGLAAGIWTRDVRQAHRVASKLKAGTVWINTYRVLSFGAPFGGYKMSGLGRENGSEVMNEYTQAKAVYVELSGKSRDPFKLG